jgi:hypothetical protein
MFHDLFRSSAYHRTLAYHDARRHHRGTKASTQERAQSAIIVAEAV